MDDERSFERPGLGATIQGCHTIHGRIRCTTHVSNTCIYYVYTMSDLFLNLRLGWYSLIIYYVTIEATKIEQPGLPGCLALCNEDWHFFL